MSTRTRIRLSKATAFGIADFPTLPGCNAYNSTNPTITNGAWNTLAFDSELYDTDTMHDLVTNNSRITCKTAGKYLIAAQIVYDANTTGMREIRLLRNAAKVIGEIDVPAASVYGTGIQAVAIYALAVTDYVEAQTFQNITGGGTLSTAVSPTFAASWIGP